MNASDPTLVERFSAALTALTGHVHRATDEAAAGRIIVEVLRQAGSRQALAWDDDALGCPGALTVVREAGMELVAPRLPADAAARLARLQELETLAVGLSGAQAGLADTGSIVLASGPGQPRLASLLPPIHIALLPVSRLCPSLPAYLAEVGARVVASSQVIVITGPSRTADIEMSLTYGVHGPREIHVVLVDGR